MSGLVTPFDIAALDVSAASGLTRLGDRFYVVADDEHFLACYDLAGAPAGRVVLFLGVLPDEHLARKAAKPDLEAVTALPGGRLLALGSGATGNRHRGVIVDPAQQSVRALDLAPLHAALAERLPALNLEGACVSGDDLWLAQRGNGGGQPALVRLDLAAALERDRWDASLIIQILPVQLPPGFGLTDLTALHDGRLLAACAAEDSADPVADGEVSGSGLALLDEAGQVTAFTHVAGTHKIEGVHAERSGQELELWLVTDPDDRGQAARLLGARWKPGA